MNALEKLMDSYWIIKDFDKEDYFEIRKNINSYKIFIVEKLGWRLIAVEGLIKIEKIPSHAESFMGIGDFNDIHDYIILCALLMYLEDKDEHSQFLLSELIHYIEAVLSEKVEVDWTSFAQRKSLVRVLQYAEKIHLLKVYEGRSENFAGESNSEVLYENTGVSRYFATSFPVDIREFNTIEDFEKKRFDELEDERGSLRSQRVFRQLFTCPMLYFENGNSPDALYIKNQYKQISRLAEDNFGMKMVYSKNMAALVYVDKNGTGLLHPGTSMISDIALLFSEYVSTYCRDLRRFTIDENDLIHLNNDKLNKILIDIKKKYSTLWSKEYREMSDEKYLRKIKEYLSDFQLRKIMDNEVIIYPSAVLIKGSYGNKIGVNK